MINTIIALFLIISFILIIGIGIWAFQKLHKTGLLKTFLKGKILLSVLTMIFVVSFIVSSIGLIVGSTWAGPLLFYTLIGWLIYVWAYNMKAILNLFMLMKEERPRGISQFMGRSEFFDELVHKSIELDNQANYPAPENEEEAHAVRDGSLEELLNDEEAFGDLFPYAIRRKLKRKIIGLVVHTVIYVVILILIW